MYLSIYLSIYNAETSHLLPAPPLHEQHTRCHRSPVSVNEDYTQVLPVSPVTVDYAKDF